MSIWKPIAEIPDEFKNGRRVLLCECEIVDVGYWWDAGACWWTKDDPGHELRPSHYMEIVPPSEPATEIASALNAMAAIREAFASGKVEAILREYALCDGMLLAKANQELRQLLGIELKQPATAG